MNKLEEKRESVRGEIVKSLWSGDADAAEDAALRIAMDDEEFTKLTRLTEEARETLSTLTAVESERSKLEKAKAKAESEVLRLVAERDAMIDEFDTKIIQAENTAKECFRRLCEGQNARSRIGHMATAGNGLPGLLGLLPIALQKDIAAVEEAHENHRQRELMKLRIRDQRKAVETAQWYVNDAGREVDTFIAADDRNAARSREARFIQELADAEKELANMEARLASMP